MTPVRASVYTIEVRKYQTIYSGGQIPGERFRGPYSSKGNQQEELKVFGCRTLGAVIELRHYAIGM